MRFYFKAKKLSGEEIEGVKETNDEFELSKLLQRDGYTLIYFKEKDGKEKKWNFSFLNILDRVPLSEKMIFSRNLSVIISAGVSLSRGLETLSRQTRNKKFQKVLKSIADEIKKGKSFSEALKEYPKIFPAIFSAMVKAGEATGKLDASLMLLAEQLQKDYNLRRRVKGALIYPAVIVSTMIIIGVLMMIYVMPTLTATFKELEADLPLTTQFLIGLSNFLTNNGVWAIVILVIILGTGFYLYSFPKTKRSFNFIVLHLPLFSPMVKKVNTARTSRTLSSLIGSGVDILSGLEVTGDVLQNHYYKNVFKEAKDRVQKGEPLSRIFSDYPRLYPPMFSDMISVGEETGKLADMLMRVATFYEEEVEAFTKNLSVVIEPILMVIIGAAVGFFAVSMIQPMYSMLEGL